MYDTDLQTHHIEGYAQAAISAGKDGYFNLPLVSHIKDNLWMGGTIDGAILAEDFDHVISLYPWERFQLDSDTCRAEFQLYDRDEIPNEASLDRIVAYTRDCLLDGECLVACQAGLNRSGLICAMVLIAEGMRPKAAIALLRKQRHELVLCNETFEKWLLKR